MFDGGTIGAQPDVVLLDLAMPKMDGLQALPLLRHAAPKCRVVVFSGFVAGAFADQVVAAGAIGDLEKRDVPSLPGRLAELLNGP